MPDPPETNAVGVFVNITIHPPTHPARPTPLCVYYNHSALLTPTILFVKLFNKKLHAVLFQPLHFLFVKVDVNLFVIINIFFSFVWFVCFSF